MSEQTKKQEEEKKEQSPKTENNSQTTTTNKKSAQSTMLTSDELIEDGIVGSVQEAEQVLEYHRIEKSQEAARILTDPYKDRKGVIPLRTLSNQYPLTVENIGVYMFRTPNEKRWLSHNVYISANRHELRTNIPALKEYLNNCPDFGVEVFANELPEDIMNEIAARKAILQHHAVENPAPIFYSTEQN